MYSGERVLMTASQHLDGHQKAEGWEGDLHVRPPGERLMRKKGTWLNGRAGVQPRNQHHLPTALIVHHHVNSKSVVGLFIDKVSCNFKCIWCFRRGIIQVSSNYIVWNVIKLKFHGCNHPAWQIDWIIRQTKIIYTKNYTMTNTRNISGMTIVCYQEIW